MDFGLEILYDEYSDSSSECKLKHVNYQGVVGSLGPTTAPVIVRQVLVTLAISPKQIMQLNKGTRRRWGDYTTKEQLFIISRYQYFLKSISNLFEIHYEYTKNTDIHIHCIVNTSELDKDIIIKSKRFFSIPSDNRGFIDVRLVNDYDELVLYLTAKTVKKYQATGILPLYYKEILV